MVSNLEVIKFEVNLRFNYLLKILIHYNNLTLGPDNKKKQKLNYMKLGFYKLSDVVMVLKQIRF